MPSGDERELPDLLDVVVVDTPTSTFALGAEDVRRFLVLPRARDVVPVPRAPAAVRGVACVDGAPMLVIDVAKLSMARRRGGASGEGASPRAVAFPAIGVVCRGEREEVVLVGAQVKSIGRLRTALADSSSGAGTDRVVVEWRGRAVPLLRASHVIADGASWDRDVNPWGCEDLR